MYLATFLTSLLSSLPITLSAPISTTSELYGEPYNCGYVLTERNSSTYASVSAFSECTAIYYNYTIPGFQDAYAYSLYGGCQCSFHLSEDDCKGSANPPMYEGPTGRPGEEPCFQDPNPKWYKCATTG
ncbi:hypothetical protein BKA58DRAFT_39194 [Alternaria rosae]|uniref:uncharacterized protein n=1 Tax=Alternaria rosae TaxID=1187941 RepID=UPI001E8D66A0|nr:uncharacterized protein BKA58DRAFT_39194 [Alternaria rosae]KAH6860761.1 hypothetical protein BKA58DRAFT_39194 [Alternaria rosae]